MKASQLYAPTLREIPAEAEIISHQMMLKAGMIRKVAAGVYTYLPLSWRVMKKLMNIIREEMDAVDGQELCFPIVQPAEIWEQSGRWQVYGPELWRVKDRNGRDFCLGPTHEEIVTMHFKNDIRSYKQLPLKVYQIQSKFRDERRPRFGLMRGREFVMKDMYSFDKDEAALDLTYDVMYEAYSNVFRRCGLTFRPVEADSGAIGGKGSHEFMVLADSGEAEVLYCDSCDYAASSEIAAVAPQGTGLDEEVKAKELVLTPHCATIDDLAKFLNLPSNRLAKALCYEADGQLVLAFVRGDRQLNEIKLQNTLNCVELAMASDEAMLAHGIIPGFIGPIDVPDDVLVVVDAEIDLMRNYVVGGGQKDYHWCNVNACDFRANIVADLRLVEDGDKCPKCGGHLSVARGIEVGQIFKLHTKYSEKLGANYVDENGKEIPAVMGCYGIGVGRTMASVIEQHNDEYGIIWPMSIAPYQVIVVPVNDKDEAVMSAAQQIYQDLQAQHVEVVLDDRKERPGVKFNDADLIGYPLRVTVGAKSLAQGMIELRYRKNGEVVKIALENAVTEIQAIIVAELNGLA